MKMLRKSLRKKFLVLKFDAVGELHCPTSSPTFSAHIYVDPKLLVHFKNSKVLLWVKERIRVQHRLRSIAGFFLGQVASLGAMKQETPPRTTPAAKLKAELAAITRLRIPPHLRVSEPPRRLRSR
ncbi:uncharacterized protein LOC120287392 [Eucalyptus grandis]|uniref:uncharacterized protein LOC120287392 n=1 Tax=Eucalyptus grandis TaxID=71139 RepID=UPI00192ECAEA|nr:uncharacterized protein LOC120287392 [Eucalyptus grandis]